MNAPVTRTDETVTAIDLLERDPGRFDATTAFRVAQAADPDLDVRADVGVSQATLPVSGFEEKNGAARIRAAFPGLLGPLGALPPAYGDMAMREERNRSRGLTAFLDMFGARLAELFVDACEKYRLPRLLRWKREGRQNGFETTLFSLAGFGTANLRGKSGVDDDTILRFAGFFAGRTRNATSLRAMLREFTGLPVEVELFRGRWLSIPEHEQSRMGAGSGVQLGVNAMAGSSMRDFSGGFRLVVGPLDYADYLALSPDSRNVEAIFALTRLFVGSGLDFDLQIILKKEEVPFCQLGDKAHAPRLGWNTWARVEPAQKDSDDAVITRRAA